MKRLLLSLVALVSLATSLTAAVRLPAIIGSHMVLQRGPKAVLWGWAAPSEAVTVSVSWSTNTWKTTASNGGRWSTEIQTSQAAGPHTIRISAGNEIVLEDVLVGEVWVCSGQSNMEWSGDQKLTQSTAEAPQATNAMIRLFYIPKATSATPQDQLSARWVVCSPEEMMHFSAVGYFFGKRLHAELGVPVGLINSNWGGTPAEVWTPREIVEEDPDLRAAAAKLKPFAWWPHEPGVAFNAMIHPITPFRIAGVIWYQGESNVSTHGTYRKLFTRMIDGWRTAWKAELPFYFAQIAPYTYDDPTRAAFLREAQTQAAAHPKTGMVVTSDLVDNVKDIHPQMKREVADRLARYALAETYGRSGPEYRSPTYRSHRVEGSSIRVEFDSVPTALVSRGGPPTHFKVAGADGRFVEARAVIDGKSVVVSSPEVPSPTAVRFAFACDAIPNLFTAEGLPVNLFRTDR
ncbi:sialate O-acetylesterase [Gordonia sp. UBA7599]|uniref:sialate O-acetylesterase n=1 Tax=Gordonia sp. UBA7599 TaxID=1946578 RepID=UPI0025BBF7E1|nr:sialate O-acetylesterase [Gordonia sp. UBA7599]